VIVPSRPTPEDVQAAANIAARLAYETTALTLPLVVRDSDVQQPASIGFPILVGRQNTFVRRLIDAGKVDIRALKPGQGLVALVGSPLGGGDGVAVIGGDDEGTLTAALEVAARLPRVAERITVKSVEDQRLLPQARGVRATDAVFVDLRQRPPGVAVSL
jgi:hypothetical protein